MKSFVAIVLVCFAAVAVAAETQTPTLAEGTKSVLATSPQPAVSATTAPAPTVVATTVACCEETASEVRLGPWQARRLTRQADRQEARDSRDCCKGKCNCDCRKKSRPTAIVPTRAKCDCCSK
jgi:hypothetical protein